MTGTLRAFELSGTVDAQHRLHVDDRVPLTGPSRVRVIVLAAADDSDELDWLRAATANTAFEYLADPAEDVYTLEDGAPFHDEG